MFAVVVCLLVSFRLVTLALRDWRVPIHAEVGWFALALGFEVMVAAGATDEWRGPLLLFVPLFFVAALASRASTVWTSGGAGELDERVRAAWIRRALIATGALVGAMAVAVVLSVEGGVFDRIGVWLTPAANAAAIAPRVGALGGREADLLARRPARASTRTASGSSSRASATGPPGERSSRARRGPARIWQRILGFLVFAAIGYAVFRAIRRFRPPSGAEPEPRVPGTQTTSAIETVDELAPSRSLFRRELPADAVRRWYAEALLALRARDVVREPWQTPTEFAPVVAEAVPACADEFARLTHAYEDVRYGSHRLDRAALRELEVGQKRLAATLRAG